jgi:hypothetical protein
MKLGLCREIHQVISLQKNANKLSRLSPRANYTERPPLVDEVGANFCRERVPRGHRYGSLTAVFSNF